MEIHEILFLSLSLLAPLHVRTGKMLSWAALEITPLPIVLDLVSETHLVRNLIESFLRSSASQRMYRIKSKVLSHKQLTVGRQVGVQTPLRTVGLRTEVQT